MSAPSSASDAVLQAIPHRPPFLFVDEILAESSESIVVRRMVRHNEAFFQGHYPGNPIMPGVLISEAVFQAGAILLSRRAAADGSAPAGSVPVLVRIQDAKFRSIVRPGDELTIEAKLKETVGKFLFMSGSVKVGDRRVMSVEFSVAMADAPQV
jgi:3-hydroxyacyl-[acyl-carrier-protein] dehydratase